MSILENLWNGNIFPFERSALKTKEYRAAMKRTEELEQQLLDLLGPGNRKLLDAFESASDEAWVMEEQDAFVTGVSFGIQILLDALRERSFGGER